MSDAYLEIKPSSGRHFSYPLEQPVVRVGRDPSCDLVIDDPLLSKVHARLQLKGEGWVLVDEGSRNGTFVAGKRASEKKEVPLKNADDITLGLTTIRFHVGTADENAPPMKRMMRSTQEYFSINDLRGRVKDGLLPEPVVHLLVKLADEVIPEAEPTRLYQAILTVSTEALKAARVAIMIQTADGALTMVAKYPTGAQIDAPQHLYAAIIERRGVVLMRDFDSNDNVRVDSGAAMALPLFSPQGVVGCLLLEAAPGESFDEASCATGAVLGALLGPCIYQTLRYKQLHIEKAQLLSELRAKGRSSNDSGTPYLVGTSKPLQQLREQIGSAARNSRAVFITGEPGTGKEAVARAIHSESNRKDRAFVPVLCEALSEDTLSRELFGDGTASKPTLYQLSVGGTLFLDDVASFPMGLQQELVSVLTAQQVDTAPRLLAASTRSLEELTKAKVLIEPFAAMFGAAVPTPALRERREDIAAMAKQLVTQHCAILQKQLTLSAEALATLERGEYRNNVRDLSHVIERAVIVVADGGTLDERHVGSQGAEAEGQSLKEAVASFERTYVLRVLAEQHGHRTRTAKVLGLSRQALSEKLRKYGLREDESEE